MACMRAMLFHNPEAGEADHSRKLLVTLLGKAGLAATYYSTRGPVFSEMLEEKADLFIAAGGDGTVGKVLRGMPGPAHSVGNPAARDGQ